MLRWGRSTRLIETSKVFSSIKSKLNTRRRQRAEHQGKASRPNQILDDWHQIAVNFRRANVPMASLMAIGSEVLGGCAREIDALVEIKNGDGLLRCGLNYLRIILARKAAQYLQWRLEMVSGIGSHFRLFGSD